MKNVNTIAREIKTAHARYMAVKSEADLLDDMLGAAIDAGEDCADIEAEWEALVTEEVRALDKVVAAVQQLGINYATAYRMIANPAYADKFASLCARLVA